MNGLRKLRHHVWSDSFAPGDSEWIIIVCKWQLTELFKKKALMVIKGKKKNIMPLFTGNYGGGPVCLGFERPDISPQSCQMRELPLTFICHPWSFSLKMAFEETHVGFFLTPWPGLHISSQAGKRIDNQLHLKMEGAEKGTNIYYHTKCHIPNLRWAAFILLISAILNQPGKWKSFIASFYYFFNRWENRFREEVKWLAWGRLAEPRLELWSAWLGSPALFHSAILPALLPHSI